MAIDFPNSPSNGDIHTVSGKRWQWDGEKWQAYGASLAPDVLYVDQGNARVGINDTTPSYSLDVTGTAHVTGAITASGGVTGALTGNADTATEATNVTATANNSTDETVYPTFVDGATGTQGIETDTGLTYNPSTGLLFASGIQSGGYLTGTLNTAAQAGITSVGTLTSLTISGDLTVGTSNAQILGPASGAASAGNVSFSFKDDTDTGFFRWNTNTFSAATAGVNRMTWAADGNVGIGTTAPVTPLHIAVANDTEALRISGAGGSGSVTGAAYLGFNHWSTGTHPSVRIGVIETDAADYDASLVFQTRSSDNDSVPVTRMTISEAGLVGIGTTAPNNLLSMAVPLSGLEGLAIQYGTETKAGLLLNPATGEVRVGALNSTGDYFVTLYADNAEAMRIDKDGNVGIGTTSPGEPLSVSTTGGSGSADGIEVITTATDSNPYVKLTNDARSYSIQLVGASSDVFVIRDQTAAANRLTVTSAGLVGIGDTSPTQMLDVGGNIAAASTDTSPVVIGTGNSSNGGNIAIGTGALAANLSGGNNVALGYNALNDLTTSGWNTAIGNYALDQITTSGAQYNTAVGYEALSGGATGGGNVAMGFRAGDNVTSSNNVIIGMQAHDIGAGNGHVVAVGYNAARCLNGSASVDVFVGPYTGYNVTSGTHNVIMGYAAGYAQTSGVGNTIIGSECARTHTTAGSLTIIGYYAGYYTTGVQNVFLGAYAGHWNTTGVNNTGIGYYAGNGYPTTGGNNTFLGYAAKPLASGTNNSVTFGDANISTLRCATTTISSLSDERDKTDIVDLDMGLDFIMRLRPRRFVWDDRHGGKVGIEDAGFVAQELQQAQADEGKTLPFLILDEDPDKLEASMGKLLPSMVLAIQELSDKVDALT